MDAALDSEVQASSANICLTPLQAGVQWEAGD